MPGFQFCVSWFRKLEKHAGFENTNESRTPMYRGNGMQSADIAPASADESPLISTIALHVMSTSEVLLFWASASVLSCDTVSSLSFCSTSSGRSSTYFLCSAKLSWGALEVLLWKQRPCRGDMSLSSKTSQDWSLLPLLCKSHNTMLEALDHTSIPAALGCCQRCSQSQAARQLYCMHWQGWLSDADISKDLFF